MKKIGILILLSVLLISCEATHSKEYLTFGGTLKNTHDSILIVKSDKFSKIISIAEDGSFYDTIKVQEPKLYSLLGPNSGKGIVFLKNGFRLKLSGNAKDFFNDFEYIGNDEGADSNNFIVKWFNFQRMFGSVEDFVASEKEVFIKKIDSYKNGMDSIASLFDHVNPFVLKEISEQNNRFLNPLITNYDALHAALIGDRKAREKLKKGNLAPSFYNYENYTGGFSSLEDFRGRYVYIDIWATWCKPCIAQIPYLKKLEEKYKKKNISFVSISIDDDRRFNGSWDTAHKMWKKIVREKDLSGVQLWAAEDYIRLSEKYMIKGIPRFILIDPQGKIIDSNAKRPADPALSIMFDKLLGI